MNQLDGSIELFDTNLSIGAKAAGKWRKSRRVGNNGIISTL